VPKSYLGWLNLLHLDTLQLRCYQKLQDRQLLCLEISLEDRQRE